MKTPSFKTIQKIPDETNRNVTYCKRKRGLLKKAIELSSLCDQHIYIAIFDENKQRLVEFQSTDDFNSSVVHHLSNSSTEGSLSQITHQRYFNQDYDIFARESIAKIDQSEHLVERK